MHRTDVSSMSMRSGTLISLGVLGLMFAGAGCASRGLLAGQGGQGPWWMQQTAMTMDGKLDLTDKPWWNRAAGLEVGDGFLVKAGGQVVGDRNRGAGMHIPAAAMLVRRERIRNRSRELEAIVWVIDDDEDNSVVAGGDQDSDCYVVDYDCDGVVDRIVDYIDDDGDDDPDEMDIRYFVGGELRYCWFGTDLDDDSVMWSLTGYEYGGPSFFEADPYGDGMIYMNKLNSEQGTWSPISECPFAFYDTDDDGFSEVVARVSAVPIDYDTSVDPDYANDYSRFRAPWSEEMSQMGVVNIRYSFDVDDLSSEATPLHYEFGFNLVGAAPYDYPGMAHYNPRRRPPQTTKVIPHGALRRVSDHFEASETGFTWHEQHDDTISIGYGQGRQKDLDYRWEGVFWIWERRFMGNTGGPGQKWNVRREWSSTPTNHRELYYSEVDRRIHLFGAEEGWIQVGHFGGQSELGEIRMYDTDDNGYFDRWEVYKVGDPVPVRVTTVRDERARRIPFDYDGLVRFYTEEVLPQAMAANDRLMQAMRELRVFEVPAGLVEATLTGSPNVRRFAQDIVREMLYQNLRQHLTTKAHTIIHEAKMNDLWPLGSDERAGTKNSYYAWRLIRALAEFDTAYGRGDYDSACGVLTEMKAIEASAGASE